MGNLPRRLGESKRSGARRPLGEHDHVIGEVDVMRLTVEEQRIVETAERLASKPALKDVLSCEADRLPTEWLESS